MHSQTEHESGKTHGVSRLEGIRRERGMQHLVEIAGYQAKLLLEGVVVGEAAEELTISEQLLNLCGVLGALIE